MATFFVIVLAVVAASVSALVIRALRAITEANATLSRNLSRSARNSAVSTKPARFPYLA